MTKPYKKVLLIIGCNLCAFAFFSPANSGEATVQPDNVTPPAHAVRYLEIIDGRTLGERVTWREGPGTYRYLYKTERYAWVRSEQLVIDNSGLPVSIQVSGEIRPGIEWSESFTITDANAKWFTPLERGQAKISEPAYYAPVKPAHDLGVLARALLRLPSKELALLPDGKARLELVKQLTIEVNGQPHDITLYAIHGLALSPEYVWLDSTGMTIAERWTIKSDWQSVLPALREVIQSEDSKYSTRFARTFLPPPRTKPLVIKNARLFDAGTRVVHDNLSVVVNGNIISAIVPSDSFETPESAEVIDANGKMLLPGLWDMHAHLFAPRSKTWLVSAPLNLASGVTTVRDVASDIVALSTFRKALDNDEAIGPHIIPIGLIDGSRGEPLGDVILTETENEVKSAVDRYADLGYSGVKTYNSIPAALIPSLMKQARQRGLYVSGHPPFALNAEQAVKAGYDELHHLQMILSAIPLSADDAYDQGESWASWYQVMAELRPESPQIKTFIELLKKYDVAIDVTLSPFISEKIPQEWIADDLHRLPAPLARKLGHANESYAPLDPLARPGWERTKSNMLNLVPILHSAGVPLTIGTDTIPGFGLYSEMKLMVEAGLKPAEVLSLSTIGAARAMGQEAIVGNIAPGLRADLILVDGDPTIEISDIRKISTVIKDGRVFNSSAIYRSLEIKPVEEGLDNLK